MLHNFPVIITKKKIVAKNTIELTFFVSDSGFSFKAGQYISVGIPSLANESVPDRYHDFSLASSPNNPKEISIVFRASNSVFKTTLLGLPVGGMVTIDGPKGVLTLPSSSDTPVFFVAGGIGIAPFMSMIRFATESASSQKITLIYCNPDKESTAYEQALCDLEKVNPLFTTRIWIGVPNTQLFEPYVKTQNAYWYIVGNSAMVVAVRKILNMSGVDDGHVITEEFSGYIEH